MAENHIALYKKYNDVSRLQRVSFEPIGNIWNIFWEITLKIMNPYSAMQKMYRFLFVYLTIL